MTHPPEAPHPRPPRHTRKLEKQRTDTQAQRDAWLELGGPKWVRRLLDEYIAAKK